MSRVLAERPLTTYENTGGGERQARRSVPLIYYTPGTHVVHTHTQAGRQAGNSHRTPASAPASPSPPRAEPGARPCPERNPRSGGRSPGTPPSSPTYTTPGPGGDRRRRETDLREAAKPTSEALRDSRKGVWERMGLRGVNEENGRDMTGVRKADTRGVTGVKASERDKRTRETKKKKKRNRELIRQPRQ